MTSKLRAGDLVEILSKEEILATLDKDARLRGLPFMPEMLPLCGHRFRVAKRAHKTCDTVNGTGGRWVGDAVHLEGVRCGGDAHGGCQAECLIFWWAEWVRRVPESREAKRAHAERVAGDVCSEADVASSTTRRGLHPDEPPTYVCQVTQLPSVTTSLPWWNPLQYIEDYTSGNVGIREIVTGLVYGAYYRLLKTRLGRMARMGWFYDRFQALRGGLPFPRKSGKIPVGSKTPSADLGLMPGELVRVKSYEDILSTLNTDNKNLGLYFDAEMVPYCGGTFRVLKRVTQILDEKTGKMLTMKKPSIMLQNVCCRSRYSDRRLFCPRGIPAYWREIWLERAQTSETGSSAVPP